MNQKIKGLAARITQTANPIIFSHDSFKFLNGILVRKHLCSLILSLCAFSTPKNEAGTFPVPDPCHQK